MRIHTRKSNNRKWINFDVLEFSFLPAPHCFLLRAGINYWINQKHQRIEFPLSFYISTSQEAGERDREYEKMDRWRNAGRTADLQINVSLTQHLTVTYPLGNMLLHLSQRHYSSLIRCSHVLSCVAQLSSPRRDNI